MSEQALITLGLLQDHDTLLKGYVDDKYKDFAMGYDYYSSIGNISLTQTGNSGGVVTYNEIVTDNTGQIASKETQIAAGGNIIVEKITLGLAAPKYRKWTIVPSSGQVDSVWSDTPPSLPPEYDLVLSNNTWETVISYSELGLASEIWSLHDTIDIAYTDNRQYTMEIIGFNHDELSDETGKACITFAMKNLLNVPLPIRSSVPGAPWKFEESYLYNDILIQDNFNYFPEQLKNGIKSVNKKINDFSEIGEGNIRKIEPMKIFLFSEIEVTGQSTYSLSEDGVQYAGFADGGTSLKKFLNNGAGTNVSWFTRSIYNKLGTEYSELAVQGLPIYVLQNDSLRYHGISAKNSSGICFGFCI